ncbi:hypothetical protein KCU90_g208, partial [Aureobasidium melanogenum]
MCERAEKPVESSAFRHGAKLHAESGSLGLHLLHPIPDLLECLALELRQRCCTRENVRIHRGRRNGRASDDGKHGRRSQTCALVHRCCQSEQSNECRDALSDYRCLT